MQQFTHVGQWGTHIDPPAHFHEGLRTVDQIPPTEMVLPLVVLDVHAKVAKNPDYTVTVEDVKAWEAAHGRIPPCVRRDAHRLVQALAQSGCHAKSRLGRRGALPGLEQAGAETSVRGPGITASGHGLRIPIRGSPPPRTIIRWRVTSSGSITTRSRCWRTWTRFRKPARSSIVTWPKQEGGTGFPARVIAIAPMIGPCACCALKAQILWACPRISRKMKIERACRTPGMR